MDTAYTASNSNLVATIEGLTSLKEENALKEVILTVPANNPALVVNRSSVVSIRSPASNHRSSCTGPVCRICHEDDGTEELISPCECAGSLGLVHTSCIEKWLSSSNTTVCEICKYQYTLARRPKSIYQWLKSPHSHNGPSGFYGDVVCLVLLTPLCIVSVYLCAIGAKVYIGHGLWEGTGLAMLCCFLMGVYVLWCFVTVRFHWKRLKRWQALNQTVQLLHKFRMSKPASAASGKVDGAGPASPLSAVFEPPTSGAPPPFSLHMLRGVANPAADCEAS